MANIKGSPLSTTAQQQQKQQQHLRDSPLLLPVLRNKTRPLLIAEMALSEEEAEADFRAMGMSEEQITRLMAMDGAAAKSPKKKSPERERKKRRVV